MSASRNIRPLFESGRSSTPRFTGTGTGTGADGSAMVPKCFGKSLAGDFGTLLALEPVVAV
jgi:hypothetical protein